MYLYYIINSIVNEVLLSEIYSPSKASLNHFNIRSLLSRVERIITENIVECDDPEYSSLISLTNETFGSNSDMLVIGVIQPYSPVECDSIISIVKDISTVKVYIYIYNM